MKIEGKKKKYSSLISSLKLDWDEKQINKFMRAQEEHYLSFAIRKRNGKLRWIDAPCRDLKSIQTNLLYNCLYKLSTHKDCMGFRVGIGVKDGASRHLGAKVLLTMDISNFFNSIKISKVQLFCAYLLKRLTAIKKPKHPYTNEDIITLSSLFTFKGKIPQGAPTSPALANLISYKMDIELSKLAYIHNCKFTRYADDIAFSSENKDFKIGKLIPEIKAIVEKENLSINYRKTKIRRPHNRMAVTGIVINEKLSVPRWKWRNFRAELHNLVKENAAIELEYWQQLRGYAEWIKTLNPQRGKDFLEKIGRLTYVCC